MAILEKMRVFISDLKDFGWYLMTEPFREIRPIVYHLTEAVNRTRSWVYVSAFLFIIFFVIGRKQVATIFLVVMLVAMLVMDWQSGFFRYRKRQRVRMKLEKVMEENKDGMDGNS